MSRRCPSDGTYFMRHYERSSQRLYDKWITRHRKQWNLGRKVTRRFRCSPGRERPCAQRITQPHKLRSACRHI